MLFLYTQKTGNPEETMAQKLVDAVIKKHGLQKLDKSVVEFDFRDRHYRATRDGGRFVYERIFEDSLGTYHDSLSNDNFVRRLNGELVELTDKKKNAYSNSVNSVIYFALLPYFLNDPAANKTHLGEVEIKGEPYEKIKVSFNQEGGGKDHEDVFIYWFHRNQRTMDYLAYNYQTDGGGARFRVAYNVREIEGVRFADYINLKPKEKTMAVETFDQLYESGGLEELSRIETENIRVELR